MNEYRTEVCCTRYGLFIFYLLKNLKQKLTQIFSVLKNCFLHDLSYVKTVPTSNI